MKVGVSVGVSEGVKVRVGVWVGETHRERFELAQAARIITPAASRRARPNERFQVCAELMVSSFQIRAVIHDGYGREWETFPMQVL